MDRARARSFSGDADDAVGGFFVSLQVRLKLYRTSPSTDCTSRPMWPQSSRRSSGAALLNASPVAGHC